MRERLKSAAPEVAILTNSGWWSTELEPRKLGRAFIATTSAKYTYGLPFTQKSERIRELEKTRGDLAMKGPA